MTKRYMRSLMTASIYSRTLSVQVQEAAKKAMEELKRDHPDVDPSNIKVDVPVSGPAKAGPRLNQHQPLHAIPAWGLPAVPDAYRAYGAGPAVDMWGVQGFRQRAELEEERHRVRMRLEQLEQAALREDRERVRRDMYMAMPPLPPIPQVRPLRRHMPPLMPRLPPVPRPAAARRRRRH